MKKIIVIGAGGFGREVEMLIDQINEFELQWDFLGFIDDGVPEGSIIGASRVLGSLSKLIDFDDVSVVISVANPKSKVDILNRIPKKHHFATLIHPNVLIGKRVKIGLGSIICAGNIITTDIKIGDHVILNLGCTVGHDTEIGDLCSFMPSINISGEVVIEKGVYVGTGAKIINQLTIGSFTLVGAGAVVSKSLPPRCTAVGIPAKPIKFHE